MSSLSLLERELFRALADKSPLVVGINGLDCSGKTYSSRLLEQTFSREGLKVLVLHIDDFNNLEAQSGIYQRYSQGHFSASDFDDYYANSIHYDDFRQDLLEARVNCDVLIAEGVFLFKESLIDLFDFKVFVEVDYEMARIRYQKRKLEVGDHRPVEVFDDIWLRSFLRYSEEDKPKAKSDFILSN